MAISGLSTDSPRRTRRAVASNLRCVMSLSTYAEAPALKAARRYCGFSCMVMRMTSVAGHSCLMLRHVASPSISGMRTSIRARSGCKRRQSASASRPFFASPITSTPRRPASIVRRPALASSWSSAITNRAGPGLRWGSELLLMIQASLTRVQNRHLGYQQGAGAELAGNQEMSAEQFQSLLHSAHPHTFTRAEFAEQSARLEAGAPVLHLQANARLPALQREPYPHGTCMLIHVGERLLHNPEKRGFNCRWQALLPECFVIHNRPAFSTIRLYLQAQSRCQPEV